ncbi:WD and tetratricopeptide repeats protein 1-like [Trifolium pratense]|uniref:WD and tetratricopeptide repeats protein 1-like n=1 Tax=Trifolium pratense TaxID=57577 RepID=A0A2K3LI74_TRIPR|nr:WD and tetratricopeptide repeats protein 1-like [Trifolium pratense]
MLSLSDILYRSEANSDTSQDGPRSDRDDSDYDEEMELGFETSISDDEEHDSDSNILHGNLNLRIHRRGDSTENVGASGSCESPSSSSSQNGRASYQTFPVQKHHSTIWCSPVTLSHSCCYISPSHSASSSFFWAGRYALLRWHDNTNLNS